MNKLVNIFKSLADGSRLRIVKMLQARELCVCEITETLGLAPSTVSKHLSILKAAGVIEDRKDGKWVYYRLLEFDDNSAEKRIISVIMEMKNEGIYQIDLEKVLTVDKDILCGIKEG